LASIKKRTSPIKFAHLAEKSENGSISNLSTKVAHPWFKSEEEPSTAAEKRINTVTWETFEEGSLVPQRS
jgi:hypothetical protein